MKVFEDGILCQAAVDELNRKLYQLSSTTMGDIFNELSNLCNSYIKKVSKYILYYYVNYSNSVYVSKDVTKCQLYNANTKFRLSHYTHCLEMHIEIPLLPFTWSGDHTNNIKSFLQCVHFPNIEYLQKYLKFYLKPGYTKLITSEQAYKHVLENSEDVPELCYILKNDQTELDKEAIELFA